MSAEPETGSAADPLDLESLDADSLFAALTAVERVSRVVPTGPLDEVFLYPSHLPLRLSPFFGLILR
jgi:hypothetical protein